ncbi:Uu.00g026770.m01.CDS01 [Anthostomella pinea]|uniref:Uu.00g026770.m01.CDS01 n=1 Tax=Anthostomella pinea TaxID=933095 RepID=A0AAI8V7G7_9PEZI|nr:Uu.00g026770.m01.CDS01 [Anthostomella pinea]
MPAMHTTSSISLLAATSTLAASISQNQSQSQSQNTNVPIVYIPLNYRYGENHKISTDLVEPWSNMTIEVQFDQGSENFWIFGPNATMNWGCNGLFCSGPCNTTVTPFYDYPNSPSTTDTAKFEFFGGYGGYTKRVYGDISVNDTMLFTSASGQWSQIPGVRVSMAYYMQQRLEDDGTCSKPGAYDKSILGTAPFQRSAEWNTTGPHVRQDLLERGVISAPVQSMWMDKAPASVLGTFTGGAVFGGVDASKFTGPLVKVPFLRSDAGGSSVGYYTSPPKVTVKGQALDQSAITTQTCLFDSGTQSDDLPISLAARDAFYNASGIVESPMGYMSWPGECESIPADLTIDLEFTGVDKNTTVAIKVPLRNYVRANAGEKGYCNLNLDIGGCIFAAPFSTAAFFAADDERGELAFAQGGVAEVGSGPDESKILLRIP